MKSLPKCMERTTLFEQMQGLVKSKSEGGAECRTREAGN